MLIRRAKVEGVLLDVRCREQIIALAPHLELEKGEQVVDARGGALLPGLHDHHIHLMALAATHRSLHCGPPDVVHSGQLQALLQAAPGTDWVRGIGYHESVAGEIGRKELDRWIPHRPVRIQHRSGKLWILNSVAMDRLNVEQHRHLSGVECDVEGNLTGRLFRMDGWLRQQTAASDMPDLGKVSRHLLSQGITGCTDTSATNNAAMLKLFAEEVSRGRFFQHLMLMGDESLSATEPVAGLPRATRLFPGQLKILLDEDNLPDHDDLIRQIIEAHTFHRGVAFHCVSRVELVFALSALKRAGFSTRDRIEHGAIIFEDAMDLLRESGCTVVTQPGFIAERGDHYRKDLTEDELSHLYRYQTLINAEIPVVCSSDAPYGPNNPWQVMDAAITRRTRSGYLLGGDEMVSAQTALQSYCTDAENPAGVCRSIAVGAPSDLCILNQPWSEARRNLKEVTVTHTLVSGELCYAQDSAQIDS